MKCQSVHCSVCPPHELVVGGQVWVEERRLTGVES